MNESGRLNRPVVTHLPFLAALSARFSFKVFSGFFLVSFFWLRPLAIVISSGKFTGYRDT